MSFLYEKGYKIADFLTLLRLFIVLLLLSFVPGGISNFNEFMTFLLIAWLTDCLDGFFARKSKRLGFLGFWDGWVDTLMYVTIFLYCTIMGYYSFVFFGLVLILNFLSVFFTRNLEVNQAFHFIYILLGFRTLLIISPEWSLVVISWTFLVIIFKWKRLKEQIVNFLSSWKGLLFSKNKPSSGL
jgi:phosphatidylglycerophosphate synthase